jgi:hypothetical protein
MPKTSAELAPKYPESIGPGETFRGFVVEGRVTRGRNPTRVLDLCGPDGVLRSLFDDRQLTGVFDAADVGDFVEVSCSTPSAPAAAPASGARSGLWTRRAAPAPETGRREPRVWAATLWSIRTEGAPDWATAEFVMQAATAAGLKKPGEEPPAQEKPAGRRR